MARPPDIALLALTLLNDTPSGVHDVDDLQGLGIEWFWFLRAGNRFEVGKNTI